MNSGHNAIHKLTLAAMLAAMVFIGSYMRIKCGVYTLTLANIFCILCGLLLGPWWGFAAAGVGSAIYDLLAGYAAQVLFTFVNKGMYALVSGVVLYFVFVRVLKRESGAYVPQLLAGLCGALAYMVLYSVKNYFYNGMIEQGLSTAAQCWALVVSKLPATVFNGVVGAVVAPILSTALQKALSTLHLEGMKFQAKG